MNSTISEQVQNRLKNEEYLFYENQILEQLLNTHKFNIPGQLLQNEISKISNEHPNMQKEDIADTAEKFVRTDLILHAIYERHPDIHFTQEQFNTKISELALRANDSIENVLKKLQNSGKLQSYVNYLTNCRVIEFLIDMAEKNERNENVKE